MKQEHQQKIFHMIVNANWIIQYVIQIKNGIVINAKVYFKSISNDSIIVYDEITNVTDKAATIATKIVPTNVANTYHQLSKVKTAQ